MLSGKIACIPVTVAVTTVIAIVIFSKNTLFEGAVTLKALNFWINSSFRKNFPSLTRLVLTNLLQVLLIEVRYASFISAIKKGQMRGLIMPWHQLCLNKIAQNNPYLKCFLRNEDKQ